MNSFNFALLIAFLSLAHSKSLLIAGKQYNIEPQCRRRSLVVCSQKCHEECCVSRGGLKKYGLVSLDSLVKHSMFSGGHVPLFT